MWSFLIFFSLCHEIFNYFSNISNSLFSTNNFNSKLALFDGLSHFLRMSRSTGEATTCHRTLIRITTYYTRLILTDKTDGIIIFIILGPRKAGISNWWENKKKVYHFHWTGNFLLIQWCHRSTWSSNIFFPKHFFCTPTRHIWYTGFSLQVGPNLF